MRLIWTDTALGQLEAAAAWSPTQAQAAVNAMEWMARSGFSLGRLAADPDERYWPVPPLGVFYLIAPDQLKVLRVVDIRRRREPWPGATPSSP